jgi:hypothetical protein
MISKLTIKATTIFIGGRHGTQLLCTMPSMTAPILQEHPPLDPLQWIP